MDLLLVACWHLRRIINQVAGIWVASNKNRMRHRKVGIKGSPSFLSCGLKRPPWMSRLFQFH